MACGQRGPWLDGQVEVVGLVDEAADLAGRCGDVQQQTAAASWDIVRVGHERHSLVLRGPTRYRRVRPRYQGGPRAQSRFLQATAFACHLRDQRKAQRICVLSSRIP
jgi:hypothetical protein